MNQPVQDAASQHTHVEDRKPEFVVLCAPVIGAKPTAKDWRRTVGVMPDDELSREAQRLGLKGAKTAPKIEHVRSGARSRERVGIEVSRQQGEPPTRTGSSRLGRPNAMYSSGNAIGQGDRPLFQPTIHTKADDGTARGMRLRPGENHKLWPHVGNIMLHTIDFQKHLNSGAVAGLR